MTDRATHRPTAPSTYRGVQALRLASGLLVVALHACHWFNRDAGTAERAPESPLLGDVCVSVFFLISGFVVVHVVDSGREPDWKTFATRRAIRILPLAWAMTTVKVVAALAIPSAMFDGGLSASRIVSSYLLLPSRDPDGVIRLLWGVEWTLVFEVAFYALVAVAMATGIDALHMATAIIVGVAVTSTWQTDDGSVLWFYADPIVLYLLVGMWIGRATKTGRVGAAGAAVASSAAAVVFAGVSAARGDLSFLAAASLFVALSAGFTLLVLSERRFGHRVPDWVVLGGDAAFALYLTHPLVAQALPRVLGAVGGPPVAWWIVVGFSVLLSVGLSLLVHRWLDVPFGRFLRRCTARGRRPLPN